MVKRGRVRRWTMTVLGTFRILRLIRTASRRLWMGRRSGDCSGNVRTGPFTELLDKAQSASDEDKVRKHPQLAKASARLAVAVQALFAAEGWGGHEGQVRIGQIWETIEQVVSRDQVRAALTVVSENVPAADAAEPDDRRTELVASRRSRAS
jgi:hypothetical protein